MRITILLAFVLSFQWCEAGDLPLYFNSGSTFTGTITHDRIHVNAQVEARLSRVGEKMSIRMFTLAGKAVVVVAGKVDTDKVFLSTFQVNNNDDIFATGKAALDEKARQLEIGQQGGDQSFRAEVYENQKYLNPDKMVALELATDPSYPTQKSMVTLVLHPADENTVTGEFLVRERDQSLRRNFWFTLKREIPPPPAR